MNLCGNGNKPLDSAKTVKSSNKKQRKKEKVRESLNLRDDLSSHMSIPRPES